MLKGRNIIQETYDKINNKNTHQQLAEKFNIVWYTIPFYKSSANGAVERLIQSVKKPLYKTLNGKILTEIELYTILTDIESAINSRPLTSLSEHSDDNNILPLTPAHLILGKSMNVLPRDLATGHIATKQNADIRARWRDRKNLAEFFLENMEGRICIRIKKKDKRLFRKKRLKNGRHGSIEQKRKS